MACSSKLRPLLSLAGESDGPSELANPAVSPPNDRALKWRIEITGAVLVIGLHPYTRRTTTQGATVKIMLPRAVGVAAWSAGR